MATVLSRRFNTGALPLCLAAMDGCWVYVVSWLLVTQALHKVAILPVPSFLVLALLELLSMWLASRLFDKTDLSDTVIQVISGVVGLAVSVLLVFVYSPPESGGIDGRWIGGAAVSVVICLVLWFLGGYRATEPPSFNQAYAMFRIGLIVIGLCASLVAVLARKDSPQIWGNVGGVALWFFAFSLAALALGNREVVREESGSTGGGSWGVVLLLSVAGIVLLGSLGGAFGTSGILDVLRTILAVLILIVGFMAYAIGFIFILYEAIFNPEVKHEKPRIPTPEDAYSISGRFGLQFDQTPKFLSDVTGIPPNVITPVLWAIGVLAVVLFVWLVGRSLRRANRVVRDEASEEREHLGSWALFVQQVRYWLMSLFRRKAVQPSHSAGEYDDLAALTGKPEWSGTLTVRQIYARMQKLAASAGYKRESRQTPLEYLRVLQSAMPDLRYDFSAITSAYIEARYGPVPAPGPAVYAAQEAWKHAEPALQAAGSQTSRASTG